MFKRLILVTSLVLISAFTFMNTHASQNEEDSTPDPRQCDAGNEIFFDDFSDPNGGWFVGQSSAASNWGYATDDEEYRVFITQPRRIAWSESPLQPSMIPSNFCVEADVRLHVAGSLSDDAYLGLAFGGRPLFGNNEDFMLFRIDPDGWYRIQRVDGSGDSLSFTSLVDWTETDLVNGANEDNHLLIMSIDGDSHFFINGEWVETLTLNTSGEVGVAITNFDAPNVNGRWDNFKVTGL